MYRLNNNSYINTHKNVVSSQQLNYGTLQILNQEFLIQFHSKTFNITYNISPITLIFKDSKV